jgi:hypothetical protein
MTPEEEYRSLRPQPSVRYIATGQEAVQKIRPDKQKKKKNTLKSRFESSSEEEEKEEDNEEDDKFIADKPREKVKLQDGACIINFEVKFEEEQEDIVYAGGIKGIRALRKQRDILPD